MTFDHRHNSWVLNFGETFHMCLYKTWFKTYKLVNGTVYIGDYNPLGVEGIGNIKLRMLNGIVRIIEHCLVPQMKKNLISLLTLDGKVYKFHLQNGALKVCKGFTVFMKDELHSRLDYLQASVVEGETNVASRTTNLNQSQLCHLRLGHISGKGLSLLNKQNLSNK